jgi:membrane-bound lytic murein transglycosylase MltF
MRAIGSGRFLAWPARTRRLVTALASLALLAGAATPVHPAGAPRPGAPWTGDLDGMLKRRQIRALVVSSKTFYFVDRGTQRGATYDALRAFEDDLNRRLRTGPLRVHVVFVPVRRDELLPMLVQGRGDLAAANLTITPERQQQVAFSQPIWTRVREVPVTGRGSPPLASPRDLAGREVFVRRSSSYHESLVRLNAELATAGRPPVRLRPAPEELEDEDLLEMVNAGLVGIVVVDSHKAEFWTQIFPNLVLHPDAAVRTGGEIAWAFRKDSPRLAEAVNRFVVANRQGTAFGNEVFRRYLKSTKWVKGATSPEELAKFRRTIDLFRRYGDRYAFDWLLLAAQGYQESQLDQSRRSPAGAVGVMQLLPATGKQMAVGDIQQLEPNVHAGVKYLRFVADRYFNDPAIGPVDRTLFAFAAYNAGPAKVASLRKEAAATGLDSKVWFNHVEAVAARRIGRETVQYVSNIFKYYVAYRLLAEERDERERAKKAAGAD